MRAALLLVTVAVGAVSVIGGRAVSTGADRAVAQTPAGPADPAVPGPMRPIVELPPIPADPVVADKRRAPAATQPAAAAPRPAIVAAPTPAAPPPTAMEGLFRPGAAGEKAQGRAIAHLDTRDLKLEKLAVTPGRDLELWLVAIDRPADGEDLGETKHVSLGRLKKAEGDQTYRLPAELDLRVYRSVVVWSRRERVARAAALLVAQPAARATPAKPPKRR